MAAAQATHRNYTAAYRAPPASLVHQEDPIKTHHIPKISHSSFDFEQEYRHASDPVSFTAEEQSRYFAPIDNEAIQKHNEELLQQEFEMLCLQADEEVLDGQPEDASIPDWTAEFHALGRSF